MSYPALRAHFLDLSHNLTINPQGVRYAGMRPLRLRLEVIAVAAETLRAPVERGWPRRKPGAGPMSQNLTLAQNHAWNLAKTLMVCVTLFRGESGFGVMLSDEFEGDAGSVIHEFDPFGR